MKDEDIEKRIDFCCFRCYCSDERQSKIPSNDRFIQSGANSLYHRRCCHKVIVAHDTWLSQMEDANARAEKLLGRVKDADEQSDQLLDTGSEDMTDDEGSADGTNLNTVCDTAKSHEVEIINDGGRTGKPSLHVLLRRALYRLLFSSFANGALQIPRH